MAEMNLSLGAHLGSSFAEWQERNHNTAIDLKCEGRSKDENFYISSVCGIPAALDADTPRYWGRLKCTSIQFRESM
jgi:hypothetical protein